jgi:hypothetical protein
MLEMQTLLGATFNGNRSLYTALGWKVNLEAADYVAKYRRQDIAARLVDIYPEYTWRQPPRITDDAEAEPVTPFEAAYLELSTRLRLTAAWHNLDRLAGLGEFAVLLLGVQDSALGTLSSPVSRARDMLYTRPYAQVDVEVKTVGQNPALETFGLPQLYSIDLGQRGLSAASTGARPSGLMLQHVHASRVIHFAEDSANGVYGTPRLERVYNRLDDMEKILGASAEAIWAGRGLIVAALRDGAQFPADADREEFKRRFDEFIHGFRSLMEVQGMDVNRLQVSIASPKDAIEAQETILAAASGVPQRILFGSERGELASSQDQTAWETTIASRQRNVVEPLIVRATIDRLIEWGLLPEPATGEYQVIWPTTRTLDPLRQADIAERMARAVATYVEGQGELVVPVGEFRERALGLPAMPLGGFPEEELDREEDTEEEGDEPPEDEEEEENAA